MSEHDERDENERQADAQVAGFANLGRMLSTQEPPSDREWLCDRCGQLVHWVDGDWLDATDGDACIDEDGEQDVHTADVDVDGMIDEASQEEAEGVLEVAVERTVRVVLCTGGPHAEIVWPEGGNPSVVCYGWFGSGRFERPLTDDETAGLEHALGEWDTLAGEVPS